MNENNVPALSELPEPFDCTSEVFGSHNGIKQFRDVGVYSADQMRAYAQQCVEQALAATPAAPPEGFVMVPVEPTTEMLVAADVALHARWDAFGKDKIPQTDVRKDVYAAMLAAAPTPPKKDTP